jgi:hypothetical protein
VGYGRVRLMSRGKSAVSRRLLAPTRGAESRASDAALQAPPCTNRRLSVSHSGGVAEWSNAAVLKHAGTDLFNQ